MSFISEAVGTAVKDFVPATSDQGVEVTNDIIAVVETEPVSTPEGTSEVTEEASDAELVETDESPSVTDNSPEGGETEGKVVAELDDDSIVSYKGKNYKFSELGAIRATMTKATQEAAEIKKESLARVEELETVVSEARAWLEPRAKDPVFWVTEILSDTSSPTDAIAAAIVKLNEQGKLDPEFAKVFKLDAPENPVNRFNESFKTEERLNRLEQFESAALEKETKAQSLQRIEQELDDVIVAHKGTVTPLLRKEILDIVVEKNGKIDFDSAYELHEARKAKETKPVVVSKKEKVIAENLVNKQRLSKVSRAGDSVGSDSAKTYDSNREAARAAINAVSLEAS